MKLKLSDDDRNFFCRLLRQEFGEKEVALVDVIEKIAVNLINRNDANQCRNCGGTVEYNSEHDNFYCTRCKQGQGQDYYQEHYGQKN